LPFIFAVVLILAICSKSMYIFESLASFSYDLASLFSVLLAFSQVFRKYAILVDETCMLFIDSRLGIDIKWKVSITDTTFVEKQYCMHSGDSSVTYRYPEIWINRYPQRFKIPVSLADSDVDFIVEIINNFIAGR
jgi:hypothetical protein